MEGRTTLVIAHRLSTIEKADRILVLDNGRMVGWGRHERLLDRCDVYRRLHDQQQKSQDDETMDFEEVAEV